MGHSKENKFTRFENSKQANYITYASIGIQAVYYFLNLLRYTVNFPYHDDYMSILDFVNTCASGQDIFRNFTLLFAQYNEHRILLTKLFSLIYHLLFGELSFVHLTLLGNISLILLIYMIFKDHVRLKQPILYLIPLGVLIFSYRYSELTFWAMASIQNLWVLTLAFLAIFFAFSEQKNNLLYSLLAATLAAFTSGNGMLVFPVIIALYLLTKKMSKPFWILVAAGIGVIGLYFIGYHRTDFADNDSPFKTQTTLSDFILYAFTFLGSIVDDPKTASIIGVTLTALYLFFLFKKQYRHMPVLFGFATFLFISSFLVSMNRHGFGSNHALSSRYTIYSILLVGTLYLMTIHYFSKAKQWILALLLITSITFNLHSNETYLKKYKMAKANFEQEYKKVSQEYVFSNFDFGWYNKRSIHIPKQILRVADNLGTFHFTYIEESAWIDKMKVRQDLICAYEIESIEQPARNPFLFVTGWAMVRKFDSKQTYCILAIKDEKGNIVKYFSCEKFNRTDINQRYSFDNADYSYAGFRCLINGSYLKLGYNYLTIILTDSKFHEKIILDTPKKIFIK